ncbi:hypothetical protein [Candidatus Hodgkinia cicadicola]
MLALMFEIGERFKFKAVTVDKITCLDKMLVVNGVEIQRSGVG